MKTNILKTLFAFIAVVMAVSISYAFFKNKSVAPMTGSAVTWYFLGTSASGMKTASNWSTTNPNNPDCGQGSDLPCDITVEASNSSQLQSYLDAHTNAQILAAANDQRPE